MNRDPQAWLLLARALREARGHQGLTQAQLAEKADVSVAAIRSAETGTVPEKRMPPTLPKIGRALGWPAGTAEAILGGAEPPGGWVESAPPPLSAGDIEAAMTRAIVTATDHVTAAEIREAVRITLDELRQKGVVSETVDTQRNTTM
ncbi:helix-turn-helix transcriptional regulator [Streptomyces xiamenensis]|uniref:helix-turn-helix transcriptional regulator n=1 Tax=Streptomyces xiamenensis TaxID=408015 RepID=UPI0037D7294C